MDKQDIIDDLLGRVLYLKNISKMNTDALQALAEAAQALVALGYKWEDERFE